MISIRASAETLTSTESEPMYNEYNVLVFLRHIIKYMTAKLEVSNAAKIHQPNSSIATTLHRPRTGGVHYLGSIHRTQGISMVSQSSVIGAKACMTQFSNPTRPLQAAKE